MIVGIVKEMPKNCESCQFRVLTINKFDDFENHCDLADKRKIERNIFDGRASWCPLVLLPEQDYADNGDGTFTEENKEV